MAINIVGSKLPQFPNTQPTYNRGSAKQVRKGTPTPPDTGFGDNGYLGPTSLPVSKSSNLCDLDTTVPDPVLDALKSGGAKSADDNWQTRTVSDTPLQSAHGQAKRAVDEGSPGGAVSSGLSSSSEKPPVRQPGGKSGA